jgi:hypothetical protein
VYHLDNRHIHALGLDAFNLVERQPRSTFAVDTWLFIVVDEDPPSAATGLSL